MANATVNEQLTDLRNRLFSNLLQKEIYTEKLQAVDLEIKAIRNLIAGIELALPKSSTED